MTQLGGFDVEIGRGRQRSGHDSSSSRESSTERSAPRRIGSPAASDDCNARMDTVADDDTPPPPSRPLIRQALGFSSDQPPQSINTYEAVPEPAPKPFFLPGQEVPIPPQPKPPKPAPKPKKPRRTEKLYPGQTSRFRLGTTYDPTPSADPPIDHGSGPYASMYRGTPVPPRNTAAQNSAAAGGSISTAAAAAPRKNASTRAKPSEARRTTANRGQARASNASQGNRNKNKNAQAASAVQPESAPTYNNSQPASNATTPNANNTPPSGYDGPSSSYYRDDSHHRNSPPPESHYRARDYPQNIEDPTPTHSDAHAHNSGHSGNSSQHRPNVRSPLRLLTILIQDQRYGETDHQLAEVKVPIRWTDPPEEGWWADSKDIARELQEGPSRIDGPARAWTLRGKYRQFILRVTADNKDHFVSANVGINPDKTLDLIVEMLPTPGAQPPAPNIPRQMIPSYQEPAGYAPMDIDVRRESQKPVNDYRKRLSSPSFDDYDNGPSSGYSNLNKAPRHSYSHQSSSQHSPRHASPHYSGHSVSNTDSNSNNNNNTNMEPSRRRSTMTDLSQAQYRYPGSTSMSPPRPPPRSYVPSAASPRTSLAEQSDDDEYTSPEPEPQDPEKLLVEKVDSMLQLDEQEWTGFFKSRGGNKVANVLQEYEYVRKKCKELRGMKVHGFSQPIMDHHIAQALNIEDSEQYIQRCHRTMDLYDIYHHEPRVVEMVNDRSPPKHGSNMHKRILHLLQDIDNEERNRRAQAASSSPRPQQQQHNPSQSDSTSPPHAQGFRM